MRIRGIPLRIHPSWIVILVLFTWSSKDQIANASEVQLSVWSSWGLGLITSLLLFLSVLLHELGHSFVALNEGVKVESITLFLLGGVARVDRECSTPMGSFRVAIAGPLVSLSLATFLLGWLYVVPGLNPLLVNLFGQVGTLNLVLGLFNLLPGLPLDGGLILKALVWKFTGSQRKGIKVATATGRNLSLIAIFLGSLICFRSGSLGGLWLVVLGWFGFTASRSQSQLLTLQQVLFDVKVSNAFARNYRVVEENESLKQLIQKGIFSSQENNNTDLVLVCSSGRWIGFITDEPLKSLPVQSWNQHLVSEYVNPLSELSKIKESSPLWQAVLDLEKTKNGTLLVTNLAGLPCGSLDRSDIGKVVLSRLGLKLPATIIDSSKKSNTYPLGLALPEIVQSMITSGLVDIR